MLRSTDKCDAQVPQSCEVLHSLANTMFIVNVDTSHQRFPGFYIDHKYGHILTREKIDQCILPSKSQDGHAVDATLNHLTSSVLQ